MATKANRSIKVSQATIDKIKKQGMTASLKSASGNNSPEYREALRRMYGDARVAKATAVNKKSFSGGQPSGYRNPKQAGPMMGQPSGYRNPNQAGPAKKPSNPRQADYYAGAMKPKSTPKPKRSGISRGAPGAPLVKKPVAPKPKKKNSERVLPDYMNQNRQR
jgi:hypothetical protein